MDSRNSASVPNAWMSSSNLILAAKSSTERIPTPIVKKTLTINSAPFVPRGVSSPFAIAPVVTVKDNPVILPLATAWTRNDPSVPTNSTRVTSTEPNKENQPTQSLNQPAVTAQSTKNANDPSRVSIVPISTIFTTPSVGASQSINCNGSNIAVDSFQLHTKGNSGAFIKMCSNYFRLSFAESLQVYQYDVKFEPFIESKSLKYHLLNTHANYLGTFILDGSVLFLQKNIGDVEVISRDRDGTEYCVSITQTRTPEISKKPEAVFQLYNIIFRKLMAHRGLEPVGRNYFDPKRKQRFPEFNFEIWPGYATALVLTEAGMMLNVGLTFKVIRTDNCLEVLNSCRSDDDAREKIIGQVVLTQHNNKTYKIHDILFDRTPQHTFPRMNSDKVEEQISFVEYYAQVHKINVKDCNQPLLVVKQKTKDKKNPEHTIFLVPELCTMTGITDEMRSNFSLMKEMHTVTRVFPATRMAELQSFTKDFAFPTDPKIKETLKAWCMKISSEMIEAPGRVLPPEQVMFAKNKIIRASEKADWSGFFREKGINLYRAVTLADWVMIYTQRDAKIAGEFIVTLMDVGGNLGIRFKKPKEVVLRNDYADEFAKAARANVSESTQIACILLPSNRPDRYNAVKTVLTTERPVPSQCIVVKTLMNRQKVMSVITKIAQQVNVKCGGVLWKLNIPLSKTMIVGIDVCHDKKSGANSVAGFCASIDPDFSEYYTRVCFNKPGQELSDGFLLCLRDALRKYFTKNGELPKNIILYRDGLGDSQLKAFEEFEIPQLKRAWEEFNGYKPRFTAIIVKKRINTRLFHNQGNPPPGTIVDCGIVKHSTMYNAQSRQFDFFLISQHVGQGTCSPSSYTVCFDESGLKADIIQQLTFKLTQMYFNWPGSISVPAPVQYAHKAAFLIGQAVHKEPHEYLDDKLFFL